MMVAPPLTRSSAPEKLTDPSCIQDMAARMLRPRLAARCRSLSLAYRAEALARRSDAARQSRRMYMQTPTASGARCCGAQWPREQPSSGRAEHPCNPPFHPLRIVEIVALLDKCPVPTSRPECAPREAREPFVRHLVSLLRGLRRGRHGASRGHDRTNQIRIVVEQLMRPSSTSRRYFAMAGSGVARRPPRFQRGRFVASNALDPARFRSSL